MHPVQRLLSSAQSRLNADLHTCMQGKHSFASGITRDLSFRSKASAPRVQASMRSRRASGTPGLASVCHVLRAKLP